MFGKKFFSKSKKGNDNQTKKWERPKRLQDHNNQNTLFDRESLGYAARSSDAFESVADYHQDKLNTVKTLAEDLFYSLYKYRPRLVGKEKVKAEYAHHRALIEAIHEMPEYTRLHRLCAGDELSAAVAVRTVVDAGMLLMDEQMMQELNQQSQQASQIDDNINQLDDAIADTTGQQTEDMTDEQLQEIADKLEQMRQEMGELENQHQDIQQQMDQKAQELANQASSGANAAAGELSDSIDAIGGLGGGWGHGGGTLGMVDPTTRKRLLNRIANNPQFRQMLRLLGRMRDLLDFSHKTKVRMAGVDRTGVTIGDQLERVMPHELANLAIPEMRLEFMRRFVEGTLMMYDNEFDALKGEGPMVIAVDCSGSMSSSTGSGMSCDQWAKALSGALIEYAHRNNREAAICFFNNSVCGSWVFPKTMPFQEWLLTFENLIAHNCCGGTAFEPPLSWARKMIDEDKDFSKADIVFITDGQCGISSTFQKDFEKWRDDRGVKVLGIAIGCGYYGDNAVGPWCHEQVAVGLSDPLTADDESVDIFSKI